MASSGYGAIGSGSCSGCRWHSALLVPASHSVLCVEREFCEKKIGSERGLSTGAARRVTLRVSLGKNCHELSALLPLIADVEGIPSSSLQHLEARAPSRAPPFLFESYGFCFVSLVCV